MEHYLYIFFTGIRRKSSTILSHQKNATENNDPETIKNLHQVQNLGLQIASALKNNNPKKFGELMHEHWSLKRMRAKTTNRKIDKWYDMALKNGAIGGKVMGAGGGGFFLFYCDKNATEMIKVLEKNGLQHIPFNFDYHGSKIIVDF